MSLLVKLVLLLTLVGAIIVCLAIILQSRLRETEAEDPALLNDMDKEGIPTAIVDESSYPDVRDLSIQSSEALSVPVSTKKQINAHDPVPSRDIITVHIFSRSDKCFFGYELLQAILAAGLRFGEMDIFHRYQNLSGQGPILFSLACATEPGTFEIQKMGEFSCTGLSLFLRLSHNPTIDMERFDLLIQAAEQLKDDLNGLLRDRDHAAWSDQKLLAYKQKILGQTIQAAAT